MVEEAGHSVTNHTIVKDEFHVIQHTAQDLLCRDDIDVLVFTGGTGVASRDGTYEAVLPCIKKELPGFGELFRMKSYEEIGVRGVLSRATGGVRDDRVIFIIPGSRNAVGLAMGIILELVGHLVWEARR